VEYQIVKAKPVDRAPPTSLRFEVNSGKVGTRPAKRAIVHSNVEHVARHLRPHSKGFTRKGGVAKDHVERWSRKDAPGKVESALDRHRIVPDRHEAPFYENVGA